LLKASLPLLHRRESERFPAIHRLKFGVAIFNFQASKREEANHRSLFYLMK
jgi:hypothetical protein